MSGDVDDIIDASEDPEIAVRSFHRGITGEIGPVAPVFALGIFVVHAEIGVHETVAVAPDGLEAARPGILDADVARLAGTGSNLVALVIENDWVNARNTWPGAARFHR